MIKTTNAQNATIIGQTIKSVQKAFISKDLGSRLLTNFLGEEVNDRKFYPVADFLKALGTLNSAVLWSVGTKIIESAIWPPGVDSFESALQSISVAYKMNHKPNDPNIIGDYIVKKDGDGKYTLTCTNLYPCDFDIGIVKGVSKVFNTVASVTHNPGPCRKKGDAKCVYTIKVI